MTGLLRGVRAGSRILGFGNDTMFCITEAVRTGYSASKQSDSIHQFIGAVFLHPEAKDAPLTPASLTTPTHHALQYH